MPTKKVFLIRNVAPKKFGGAEIYQLKIARELKNHGFEPAILTNSKELLRRAKIEGFKTFIPPYIVKQNWSGLKNFLLPLYYLEIALQRRWYERLFSKEQPLAVNIQSRDDWLSATKAAQNLRIKIIWTDHADFRNWVLWNIDKKFKNRIGKSIMKVAHLANKIVFISDCEYNWFTSIPAAKRLKNLTIIKNGAIDRMEKYKNIKKEKNSFCYVGRIIDYKGVHELINAFKEVSSKYPDSILNIYGDGPDLATYQKEAKTNKQVFFHGYSDEPLRAIAENETFILPSYREGLSLSLLDAAMMQKTIIATDVGSTKEIIKHGKTGLLVRPQSVKALVNAMLEILEDKTLARSMARSARICFEKEFNLDQIFEKQMLPLYREDTNV